MNKPHTKEECITVAKKYKTRSEFHRSEDGKYYLYACIKGWLDDVCSHMERKTGCEKRLIYAYEFCVGINKYVYVGLTYNMTERNISHHKKGSVFDFCRNYGIKDYKPKILSDKIDAKEASGLEGDWLQRYIDNGYIPINKAKCGSLGGLKCNQSEKKAIDAMQTCKSRKEFNKRYFSLYLYVLRNNKSLLDIYLPLPRKAKDFSTKELIQILGVYKTSREAKKNHPSLVYELYRRGIKLFAKPQKSEKTLKYKRRVIVEYKGNKYNSSIVECANKIFIDFGRKSKEAVQNQIYKALKSTDGKCGKIYATYDK